MGSGASKEKKIVTNVDVQLSADEKQRFVDTLRQQLQEDQLQAQRQQQLQLQHLQQQLLLQQQQLQSQAKPESHTVYTQTEQSDLTEQTKELEEPENPDDDSDYQSDPEDEVNKITYNINDDIDYTFLERIVLNTHETVDSDDEDNDTSSSSPSEGLESIDEGIVEEVEINGETVQQLKYQPNFAEFPSHKSLRVENLRYWSWKEKYSVSTEDPNAPEPTKFNKADIFDINKFADLDKHALEAPRDLLNGSSKDVVTYLTKNCQSDLQKARVLFRWCAAQNLAQLPDVTTPGSVLQTLKNIHEDKDSYGKLYNDLLSFSGLKCKHLRGNAKAVTYKLGESIDFESGENDWTAVLIDNVWRLVDLHFAARKQTGGSHGEWELIDDNGKGYTKVEDAPVGLSYYLDEFYFLTDPEEFVYDHLPNDDQWQLLARTITKDEYRDMAYLHTSFFELDLDVRAARRCVVHAPSGESIIKFGMPKTRQRKFMYQLWKSTKDGVNSNTLQGQLLSQFVYMEQKEGILICKISFPLSGKYKFQLFGKDSDDSENQSYSWAADYLILCTKEKEDFTPMPTNTRQEWGPGHDMKNLGLNPISHPGGVIETEDGHVHIKFEMKNPVELLAKLRGTNDKSEELQQWVVHREENGEVTINLRLQEKGTYALDLYAKPEGQEGTYPHVCTYLINAADGVMDKLQFPQLGNQMTGPTSNCKQFTLTPVTHKDSYFTSVQGQEDIGFEYSVPLEFTTNLHHQSIDGINKIENHIFVQQLEDKVTFKTRFPKAGIYLMNIFAKFQGSEGSYNNAYNYIIYVPKPMEGCKPFPKLYSKWGKGCEVDGLEEGIVGTGEEIEVRAKIPGATGVAFIEGSDWTYLQQNSEGEWSGKVKTGDTEQNLKLSACYVEGATSYTALAEYEVKTKEQLAVIEEEQNEEAEKEEEKKRKEEETRKEKEEEFLKIKKELEKAINSKGLNKLRAAVKLVEVNSYTKRLKEDYNTARNMIKSLERIMQLQSSILKMNQATMAEIRSYPQPPKAVHQVMMAAFLALKQNESITKDWKKCQALGNTNNLKKLVKRFDVHNFHPEIASRTKKILQNYRLEEVAITSRGAACFYAWTIGMAEEVNILRRGSVKKSKPADIKRQKEIFNGKA